MVKILNEETNYWLVRTTGGTFYEQFVAGNFIGIGWNEISDLNSIKEAKDNETKKEAILKIIRELVDKESENELQKKGEREKEAQKSRIFNQINRFVNEMAVGDYVLIPSSHSELIEFGIIASEAKIVRKETVDMEEGECDFVKRRDIEWVYREKRDKLDPYLYKLIYSQHAISSANDYAHYIDRTINRFYIKGNQAHMVIEVQKKSDIYGIELIRLINAYLDLIDSFNTITKCNLDKDEIQIKINVQSPGLVEFFGHIDEIAIMALVTSGILGGKFSLFKIIEFETPGLLKAVKEFIEHFHNYDLEKEKIALQESQQSLQTKNPPELQVSNQEENSEKP